MQLSELLARLTPDERKILIERRLGPNAVALDNRALADQLSHPTSMAAAFAELNNGQLLLLRWLATRPHLRATWSDLLEALGDRLRPALRDRYLQDIKLLALVDFDPRADGGYVATYPAVAARLPSGRGVPLEPQLTGLNSDVLMRVCSALGLRNPPTRKDGRVGLLVSTLSEPASCRGAVERLSAPARALFEWVRERGGWVGAAEMNQRVPNRRPRYVSGYGSIGSFWQAPPKDQPLEPLTELVQRMLVVPISPYGGSWYTPSAFAITTEVEMAYSGRTLLDLGPMEPPPLEQADQVDGTVPNPANLLRDIGHLLGFIGADRCEWRQDGQPYKRSLVALGKLLGGRDGEYAEQLWDLAVSGGLLRPHRGRPLQSERVAVGKLRPGHLLDRLLAAWVNGGPRTSFSLSPSLGQTARFHLLELLQLMPADTWVTRSSLEGWLRFQWPTIFAPEYLPQHAAPPDPGWSALGNLILAHGTTADGKLAVMVPGGHQDVIERGIEARVDEAENDVLPPWDDTWIVQPDRSIVAPPNAHPDALVELWQVAQLESSHGASVFKLSANTVASALNRLMTPNEIRSLLEKRSRVPLPPTVERLIDDQGKRYGRIKVGAAQTFVQTDDPGLLEELRRDKKLSKLAWHDVAPGVAFILSTHPAAVLDSLRQAGYLPVMAEPVKPSRGKLTEVPQTASRPGPRQGSREAVDVDRRTIMRLVNTAINQDTSLLATWIDDGGPHTAELEPIDLHDDEIHAFNLKDGAREILIPFNALVELASGDPIPDDFDDFDDLFDDEEP